MKKHSILYLLIVLCYTAHGRIAWGPEAGLVSAGIKSSVVTSYSTQSLTAFKAGMELQSRINPNFYFRTGLFYSPYGYKVDKYNSEVYIGMAEVPAYFLLKTGMPCKPRFILGAGLLAMSPVHENDAAKNNQYPELRQKSAATNSLSFGWGLLAGIEMPRGFSVKAAYQKTFADGSKTTFHQYSITVGYLVNKLSRK